MADSPPPHTFQTGRLDAFDEILEENLVVLLQEGADLVRVLSHGLNLP